MNKIIFVFIALSFCLTNSFSQDFNKINNHLSWDENILISPDSIFLSYGIDSTMLINNSDSVVILDSIYNKSYSSYYCSIKLDSSEYFFTVSPYETNDTLNVKLDPKDTALFFINGIDVCPICKTKYDWYLKDTLVFIFTGDSSQAEKLLKIDSDIPLAVDDVTPYSFYLLQNYPNPFNPATTIEYSISSAGFVQLKIFDILGNEITTLINEEKQPGIYQINFNAQSERGGLASGLYFYQLKCGNLIQTKKMILLK